MLATGSRTGPTASSPAPTRRRALRRSSTSASPSGRGGDLMRAAVCRQYGPPDVVEVVDVPDPEPGAGQVRVRVRCAAVNFPDVLLIANEYQVKVPTPFIPGSEWCGEVVEAAPDVTDVGPGDLVMGTGIVGAFAEQVVTSAAGVLRVPTGLDPVTAAAFGVGHRTAYHVLRSVARVQPGDEVVVLGAGGGVGTATVQLARLL